MKRNKNDISKPEEVFPDYQPKNTPDTMLDYMPSIEDKLEKIPDAEIENLLSLASFFKKYIKEVELHPGQWEDGNILLGAREREYRPSEPELLLYEVGERLQSLIDGQPEAKQLLENDKIFLDSDEYLKFTFIHMDVMGSGRFYYVDRIEKCKIKYR